MSRRTPTATKHDGSHHGSPSLSSSLAATAKGRESLRGSGQSSKSLTTLQQRPLFNIMDIPNRCSAGLALLIVKIHTSPAMLSQRSTRDCLWRWTRLCVSFKRALIMASFEQGPDHVSHPQHFCCQHSPPCFLFHLQAEK
jgi:hypothetical protein